MAKRFAREIAAAGGHPGLYSVWPQESRPEDFTRAIDSYRLAAEDVHGWMLPVASAWLATWRRDATVKLYSPDGLHPSVEGSYLAGLVIYSRIMGRSPVGLPRTLRLHSGQIIAVNAAWLTTLQQAALEVSPQ